MLKTTSFRRVIVALILVAGFAVTSNLERNESTHRPERAVAARAHQRRTTDRFFERAAPTLPNSSAPKNPALPETQTHHHHNHLV